MFHLRTIYHVKCHLIMLQENGIETELVAFFFFVCLNFVAVKCCMSSVHFLQEG